jgi:hypothetical protein
MAVDQICATSGIEVLDITQNTPIATARSIFLETLRVSPGYRIPKKAAAATVRTPTARASAVTAPRAPAAERTIKRLRDMPAKALADRVARSERSKPKRVPKNQRFCKLCQLSCNGAETFYDHIHSKGHQNRRAIAKVTHHCTICDRDFESHQHLSRHLKSKNLYKTASQIN